MPIRFGDRADPIVPTSSIFEFARLQTKLPERVHGFDLQVILLEVERLLKRSFRLIHLPKCFKGLTAMVGGRIGDARVFVVEQDRVQVKRRSGELTGGFFGV